MALETIIEFYILIPLLILIYTFFRFFDGKRILKEKKQLTGKIPLKLLFNYHLFSLKAVIATLSVGLLNVLLLVTLQATDSLLLKLLLSVLLILLSVAILIFMRDIPMTIIKERIPKSWNLLTWAVNRENFLKVINGDRELKYPVSLWIKNFNNSATGDLIFYSEKSEDGITGRWIVLRITDITKTEDTVTVGIEPCRIVSDGTIEIQDELKKCKIFTTDESK